MIAKLLSSSTPTLSHVTLSSFELPRPEHLVDPFAASRTQHQYCNGSAIMQLLPDESHCCTLSLGQSPALHNRTLAQLAAIVIPRPAPLGQPPPAGLGKVIVEYTDMDSALKARNAMHGRKFAGRTVTATFLPEAQYTAGQF